MKKIYKFLLFIAAISFCMVNSSCQDQKTGNNNGDQMKQTFTSPDSAAEAAISVLQTLASNEKLKGTINLSPDEARQLKAGKAIAVQEISYNDLLKANPDSVAPPPAVNPEQQPKWLYPLEINNTVKTTAVVTKTDGSWRIASAGDNTHVEMLSSQKPEGASGVGIIEVPGLHVSFLRVATNDTIVYIANRNLPEAKIEKGQRMNERQALQLLAAYARLVESKYGKDIKDKKVVD